MAVTLTACGEDDVTLTVMAAKSLTNAFAELEITFEKENPGIDVVIVTDSSSNLANQIIDGAGADVFASADEAQLARVADEVGLDQSRILATNSLVIVVAPGNPRDVRGLSDLGRDDVLVAGAEDGVPIREYTDRVLADAGVDANYVTFETNVAGILTKVTTGGADAGIVYVSDLVGIDAESVDIPAELNVIAVYPIAVLADSSHLDVAREFMDFATSDVGLGILRENGFETS